MEDPTPWRRVPRPRDGGTGWTRTSGADQPSLPIRPSPTSPRLRRLEILNLGQQALTACILFRMDTQPELRWGRIAAAKEQTARSQFYGHGFLDYEEIVNGQM